MKPTLITGYVDPDLDGIAGMMACCELLQKTGKNSVVGILGEPHEEAKYILDKYKIKYPQMISNSDGFDEVILVDASDLIGLEGNIDPGKVIEIIDHRKINEADKFPNAKVQIEFVGSASTLIAEKFVQNNINISKESAVLLCGAIISNTLNFKGGLTTERDKTAFEYLSKTAQLSENFWEELFLAKSNLSGSKLEERILGDMAWFELVNKKICITQIEMIGVKKLLNERVNEIVSILKKMKSEMGIDYIFQNTIDLKEEKSFFVTGDIQTQKLLEKVFHVKFNEFIVEAPKLLMRKQLMPIIKEELENNI